jgi:hypothetical protein
MPDEGWKRRHAVQIVAQLPENPGEALEVLELARSLVQSFLMEPQPALVAVERSADIRAFPASASSR